MYFPFHRNASNRNKLPPYTVNRHVSHYNLHNLSLDTCNNDLSIIPRSYTILYSWWDPKNVDSSQCLWFLTIMSHPMLFMIFKGIHFDLYGPHWPKNGKKNWFAIVVKLLYVALTVWTDRGPSPLTLVWGHCPSTPWRQSLWSQTLL